VSAAAACHRRVGPSLAAAADWAAATEQQIDQGRYVDRRPAERTTLDQAIAAYAATAAKPDDVGRLAQLRHREPALCQYAVARLTPALLAAWCERRVAEASVGTARRELKLIGDALEAFRLPLDPAAPVYDVDVELAFRLDLTRLLADHIAMSAALAAIADTPDAHRRIRRRARDTLRHRLWRDLKPLAKSAPTPSSYSGA
jgi:hypothetical protein